MLYGMAVSAQEVRGCLPALLLPAIAAPVRLAAQPDDNPGGVRRKLRGRTLAMVARLHDISRDRLRAFLIPTVQQEPAATVNRGKLSAEEATTTLNRFLV
jgi:hypothetical protein